jgi:hypothetical protein
LTTILLNTPDQAAHALQWLYRDQIKPQTADGKRLRLTLRAETRRDGQNAHFHAQIADIAAHLGGDMANEDDAKRILLSAFKIDTLQDFADEWKKLGDLRIGRGLRGETVLMGNQTRDLSVKLAAAFIEWLNAFGAENGVQFKAPKSWEGMR